MISTPHANVHANSNASGRLVFIVDDDVALVEALSDLLREEGYAVEAHTDVTGALERLHAGIKPDVVLLDYLMPGMNGRDFLVELEREGIDVPVMLFTAMNESRVQVPKRNVRAVIRKPFDLERLLQELSSVP
ncbi:MAG: response regulator [Polyangiaceae bacterium]|nr:response regulator [Polyangiaceae bacterium]